MTIIEALRGWLRTYEPRSTGRQARKIEVSTSGYPFQVDGQGTARYQIQLRLEYFQKGAR